MPDNEIRHVLTCLIFKDGSVSSKTATEAELKYNIMLLILDYMSV